MPRLDYTVSQEQLFSYYERLMFELLFAEINTLRQAAGLPVRSAAQIRAAIRQYLRNNPRPSSGRAT